jgi:hypothetical protein
MPGEYIEMGAMLLAFGIPIIAILTHHQRKMAELIHRSHAEANPALMDEVGRLRDEVRRLREELHATTIALDDARHARPVGVQERVGER